MLKAIYVVICMSEPIALALAGKSPTGPFKFSDVSWPFGAALIVVGLLPATPLFDQVELAVRRFAHRAANIPEGFLERVTRLQKSQLAAGILKEADFSTEANQYTELKNILVAAGFPRRDSEFIARSNLLSTVFYDWTVAPQSSALWSAEARAKFSDITASISIRVIHLRDEVSALIKSSLQSKYMKDLNLDLKLAHDWDQEVDFRSIQTSHVFDNEPARREIFERWEPKGKELTLLAKQLIALFVVFAANDGRPNTAEPLTKIAIDLAAKEEGRPFYNAGVAAILSGFVASLVGVSLLHAYLAYEFGAGNLLTGALEGERDVASAIVPAIQFGVLTSLNLGMQFAIALLIAIAIRYSRKLSGTHHSWALAGAPPISQSAAAFFYSAFVVCCYSLVIYIIYQWRAGDLTSQKALHPSNITQQLYVFLTWSIVPALFAIGATIIADLTDEGKTAWIPTIAVGTLLAAAATIVLMIGGYEPNGRLFWLYASAASAFSITALLVFRRNAVSIQRPEDNTPFHDGRDYSAAVRLAAPAP